MNHVTWPGCPIAGVWDRNPSLHPPHTQPCHPPGCISPTSPRGARTKCLLLEMSVTSAHPQQPGWLIRREISAFLFLPALKHLSLHKESCSLRSEHWANKSITKGICCQSPERVKAAVGEVWGDVCFWTPEKSLEGSSPLVRMGACWGLKSEIPRSLELVRSQ